MKIIAISDTHLFHKNIPECDLLIHAGDACRGGAKSELKKFRAWFRSLPARHKVYVPGNHDKVMETARGQDMFKEDDIHLLMGESVTTQGLKIWGSPVTPQFFDWSFMMPRGPKIAAHWAEIPDDTDILVTHGPPFGIGDRVRGRHVGCIGLLNRVAQVGPRVHIFGHIHEGAGVFYADDIPGTMFINAAQVDGEYRPVLTPVEFHLKT